MGWIDLFRGMMGWWSNVTVTPITRVSAGWNAPASRLHYDACPMRLDYHAPKSLVHFSAFPMRLEFTAPKSRTEGEANEP
jgi:hypothetical protein